MQKAAAEQLQGAQGGRSRCLAPLSLPTASSLASLPSPELLSPLQRPRGRQGVLHFVPCCPTPDFIPSHDADGVFRAVKGKGTHLEPGITQQPDDSWVAVLDLSGAPGGTLP